MKYRAIIHKAILIYFLLNTVHVFGKSDSTHKYQKDIVNMLEKYFVEVDKKNIDGISQYLKVPLSIHHNQGKVYFMRTKDDYYKVFNLWKESPNADFHKTEIDRVVVTEVFKGNLFMNVADLIYSRFDEENNLIIQQRVTYYIMAMPKKGLLRFLNRWIWDWKIYMISNVEMDE